MYEKHKISKLQLSYEICLVINFHFSTNNMFASSQSIYIFFNLAMLTLETLL